MTLMTEISFKVEGITPRPWQRPRFNSTTGAFFTDNDVRIFKERIAERAKQAMGKHKPFEEPVIVMLHFFRKYAIDGRLFGDVDNLAKSVLDALNGICYDDDRRVTYLLADKQRSDNEGLTVKIMKISN